MILILMKNISLFQGIFQFILYFCISVINTKILFTEKFGIPLSNNLFKRIGGIVSYITLKERDKRTIKQKNLDLVDDNNKKIAFEYFYKIPTDNDEYKENSFIIICNDKMRENMKKNSIRSFYFDCTYKCVPPTPNKYRLLVLSGFDNIDKKTILNCFVLCSNEKNLF